MVKSQEKRGFMEKDMWFICKCGHEEETEFITCPACARLYTGGWIDKSEKKTEE